MLAGLTTAAAVADRREDPDAELYPLLPCKLVSELLYIISSDEDPFDEEDPLLEENIPLVEPLAEEEASDEALDEVAELAGENPFVVGCSSLGPPPPEMAGTQTESCPPSMGGGDELHE